MQQLSQAGQQAINDVARRHGFSFDAVATMLDAVAQGNGSMAQFNHVEFSGSGQWMSGGMTMVSDMFNNQLKGRVDSLCTELANLLASQPGLHASSLFVPPGPDWWGTDLRWPNSTGAQNNVRYAYFAQARRLAIEVGGRVTVYDTLDHQIGGFSQQQGGYGSMSFNSQYGLVDVGSLPVVSVDGVAAAQPMAQQPWQPPVQAPLQPPIQQPQPYNMQGSAGSGQGSAASEADVFATLERLADLCSKGVLTQAEYQAKKAELLARL